jgi:hypothetical protein
VANQARYVVLHDPENGLEYNLEDLKQLLPVGNDLPTVILPERG